MPSKPQANSIHREWQQEQREEALECVFHMVGVVLLRCEQLTLHDGVDERA